MCTRNRNVGQNPRSVSDGVVLPSCLMHRQVAHPLGGFLLLLVYTKTLFNRVPHPHIRLDIRSEVFLEVDAHAHERALDNVVARTRE